ncbi:MAG: GTPase HflX [Nitrospiraceae bacterium]|nr:GTPase HflX [Nitrospiraceae bacterium]
MKEVVTYELARYLASLSFRLGRQIGVLIDRRGAVLQVMAGDAKGIFIPSLEDHPLGRKALRGLRLIHTHLNNDAKLTRDDLTDLALLRFDLVAAIGVREDGQPGALSLAHLSPGGDYSREDEKGTKRHAGQKFEVHDFGDMGRLRFDFREFVSALEGEMARRRLWQQDKRERAILVGVSLRPRGPRAYGKPFLPEYGIEESMDELKELAGSAGVLVLDSVVQRPKEINPKYLMGEGKMKELIIDALDKGATLLIFDQDLSPSQIKAITGLTELKVIDRSQLILDIFARRAGSREGKVQVELAQLKYLLPRLTGKGSAMSRLMGGIGGRGPGETKLEVDRRRVRDRIHFLERQLKALALGRVQRKKRRVGRGMPIVSIVGYTNAGKSTLLNALTGSETATGERMFATLDTASRRLRLPGGWIILTDTVGFIRDLPKDLIAAFKATLEELEDADLLLHLVDVSNPEFTRQMDSVSRILEELGLSSKPRLLVFNKADRITPDEAGALSARFGAVCLSALDPSTFGPLIALLNAAALEREVSPGARPGGVSV